MQPLRVKKYSIPTVVDSMPSSNVLSTSQLKSQINEINKIRQEGQELGLLLNI